MLTFVAAGRAASMAVPFVPHGRNKLSQPSLPPAPGRAVSAFIAVCLGVLALALTGVPAKAACTLPNQLANGQTADATQVMANMNALANCAGTPVTGTPAAGNLTTFSGPNSITNGNLTGAVTTSGSTATTASNPFPIGSAQIAVRHGAGAPVATGDPEGSIYLRTDTGELYQQGVVTAPIPTRIQEAVAGGTFSVTLPAPPTQGNFLVAMCYSSAATPTVAAGSGWFFISQIAPGTPGGWTDYGPGAVLAYHLVGGAETSTQTPCTGATVSNRFGAEIIEVYGLGTTFPNALEYSALAQAPISGNASVTLSHISTNANDLYVGFGGWWGTAATIGLSLSSGYSNQVSALSGGAYSEVMGSRAVPTSGTSVVTTVSLGTSWYGLVGGLVVLKPTTDIGYHKKSELTAIQNAGSPITLNPRSLNCSTGMSCSDDGAGNVTMTASGGTGVSITAPQGRLTLSSNTPVMAADAVAQTTIYYTPYVGTNLPIANVMYRFSQISYVLNTTAHVSGNLYDIGVYNNAGTLTLCTGPAWTSSTTRAAAIQQDSVSGMWTNTASLTCNLSGGSNTTTVPAGQWTYLGTFYATANGQTGMAFQPAAAAGGTNNVLGLYNAYNRVRVVARDIDSTATWTYNSATWRALNGNTNNRIRFVSGLQQGCIEGRFAIRAQGNNSNPQFGMTLDGTGAPNSQTRTAMTNGLQVMQTIEDSWLPQLGSHFVQAVEADASGTHTAVGAPNMRFELGLEM